MNLSKLIFFLGILSASLYSEAEIINSIKFEGLTQTKESFLRGIIHCKEKQIFDVNALTEDEQALRNLNLFFSVNSKYQSKDKGVDIVFIIVEAKYLYPILTASGFKDQLILEVGFNHINVSGRGDSFGFLYKYYDRHSFSIFHTAPYHKNGKTGHEIALSKYSTIEPLYFEDTSSNFRFDNYSLSVGGFYWLNRNIQIGLGGMLMREYYLQLDSAFTDLNMQNFMFNKYQIRTQIRYEKINKDLEFRDGLSNTLYFETVQTQDVPKASFFKITNNFRYYKRVGEKGNFVLRNQLGIATNNYSPFSPFVLDGFINVRGVGNRIMRGTAEAILNLEYRYSIWSKEKFAIQLVGFTDFGTLREAGDRIVDMFSSIEMKVFTGLGIRLNSRVFYKTSFRLDYGFSPVDLNKRGISFGFGQFF